MKKAQSPFRGDVQLASDYEASVWDRLTHSEASFSYETERIPYVLQKDYIPDFVIDRPDGSKFYVEVKGYFDLDARSKMLAVRKQHPLLDIGLLFMRDNFINPKKPKLTYSQWADKNGFHWAVQCIPLWWITGNSDDTKEIIIHD